MYIYILYIYLNIYIYSILPFWKYHISLIFGRTARQQGFITWFSYMGSPCRTRFCGGDWWRLSWLSCFPLMGWSKQVDVLFCLECVNTWWHCCFWVWCDTWHTRGHIHHFARLAAELLLFLSGTIYLASDGRCGCFKLADLSWILQNRCGCLNPSRLLQTLLGQTSFSHLFVQEEEG